MGLFDKVRKTFSGEYVAEARDPRTGAKITVSAPTEAEAVRKLGEKLKS